MSAASALAGWTNHDSGGQGGFLAAFPGAQNRFEPGIPPPQFDSMWPPSPFSTANSPGSLFAHHQEYAMNLMGAGRFRSDWLPEGPSSAPGPWLEQNHASGFEGGRSAGIADSGGWFGKEGQRKMQQLGLDDAHRSPRGRVGFFDDDELEEEWEDDWPHSPRHAETDWDFLDDFAGLNISHKRRRHRSPSPHNVRRQRRHSYSYSSSFPSSPLYQLQNLSNVSFSSSRNRSFLNLLNPNRNNQASRPRPLTWRADYTVRPTLLSKVSLLKSPSAVEEFNDSIKRALHPYLHFSGIIPSLSMDLRMNPRYLAQSREARRVNAFLSRGGGTTMVHFLHLPHSPEFSRIQLTQPACLPPAERMRLYHPRLPWYVDVVQTGCGVVTVKDVIVQVWMSLQTQVLQEEYWTEEMDDAKQKMSSGVYAYGAGFGGMRYGVGRSFIGRAWGERCMLVGLLEGDEALRTEERATGRFGKRERVEMSKGVKRVDWLGAEGAVRWIGLKRKGGIWEIQTQTLG